MTSTNHVQPDSTGLLVVGEGDQRLLECIAEQLAAGRESGFIVGAGHSMFPTLLPGDLIQLRPLAGMPQPGMIVTFRWQGRLLTHRVIRVRRGHFWACGDAASDAEGPVSGEAVVGQVIGCWRGEAYTSVSGWLKDRWGLLVNRLTSSMRAVDRRWPSLRKLVEERATAIPGVRSARRWIARSALGRIRIAEAGSDERLAAELVGRHRTLRIELVTNGHAQNARGDLAMWTAEARRAGVVGRVLLGKIDFESEPAGIIFGLWVRFPARRIGVGRQLLARLEQEAARSGLTRLFAFVDPDNGAASELFFSSGYRRLSRKRLAGWVKAGMGQEPPGERLFEKPLS